MKKVLLYFICLCTAFSACTKGEGGGLTPSVEEEQYYVKYIGDSISGQYSVSYEDTKGTVTLSDQREAKFERTVGPVSKGFKASLRITCGYYMPPTVRIEVKKGNAPFVVKAEKVGSGYVGASVSYVIE